MLAEAERLGARTICSPSISSGTFGFPADTAADVALRTVAAHLNGDTTIERVTFVLRDRGFEAFRRRLATL